MCAKRAYFAVGEGSAILMREMESAFSFVELWDEDEEEGVISLDDGHERASLKILPNN